MTYLWIGLGGALGSISRAWLAVAVARLAGPEFPWGTILINIVGSFLISFFGTLTANDSRFAAGADLRAFVMVGICGGFTTFSSFSLQTLELARDGRVAQAAWNIGLSVVLCLLAVTAGYASATGLQRTRPTTAGAERQQRVAVVLLDRPEDASTLIGAGARLLALEGGGEVRALIMHPPSVPLLPSEEVMTGARAADLPTERAGAIAALRQAARAALGTAGQGTLLEIDGASYASVAEYAAGARAVVASRPRDGDGQHIHDAVRAALFEAGCPVLLLPPGDTRGFGRIVAIAWNGDGRAGSAVRDSLPLLRTARAVHVLCAGGQARMPSILQQAGIRAQLHALPDAGGAVGERLLAATGELGADLLVMGAFTHGAWREGLFGGVTRTVLAGAQVSLFMRH